jgi:anti-sigma factor RsiW
MNCHQVRQLLNPYVDGELDLMRKVEVEEHLGQCEECLARDRSLRSLRSVIATEAPYYRAPRQFSAFPDASVGGPTGKRNRFTGTRHSRLRLCC